MRWQGFLIGLLVLLGGLTNGAALLYAQQPADARCFPETGQCISGRIREYWEQNGGLPVFGFPTAPQQEERIEGKPFQTQWFERNRLELHPENAAPYDVLLGRLGAEQTQQMRVASLPEEPLAGCLRFEQTQHSVCGEFAEAWQRDGLEFDGQSGKSFAESLALWGLPLTNRMTLTLGDGKPYQVQYFERARFEYHPENAAPFNVLFGLLGNEARASFLPPRPQTLLPAPLFFLYDNQIFRLERDGLTQVPIVDERGKGEITTFSVAPSGSVLAYVLKSAGSSKLIRHGVSDGNRAELLVSSEPLDTPFWSPDGTRIALHSGELLVDAQGSILVVPSSGGPARRALPDNNTNAPRLAYLPAAWSPDGSRLLVNAVPKQSEGCLPMVFTLSSEQLSDLPQPQGRRVACGGAWASDGELLISIVPDESAFAAVGLWRVDLDRGQITPLVEPNTDLGFNLFAQLQPLANGTVSAIMAKTPRVPQLGDQRPIFYSPYSILTDGTQQRHLGTVAFELRYLLGWSPDGSGFLLHGTFDDPIGRVRTYWVPLDGGAPYEINNAGRIVGWGVP